MTHPPDSALQAQPTQIVTHLIGRVGFTIHPLEVSYEGGSPKGETMAGVHKQSERRQRGRHPWLAKAQAWHSLAALSDATLRHRLCTLL